MTRSPPGWPGEPDTVAEAREHPELVANVSIDDAVAHYTKIIDSLDASPILIGHSFGGLFAEKLLGQGIGGAGGAGNSTQRESGRAGAQLGLPAGCAQNRMISTRGQAQTTRLGNRRYSAGRSGSMRLLKRLRSNCRSDIRGRLNHGGLCKPGHKHGR